MLHSAPQDAATAASATAFAAGLSREQAALAAFNELLQAEQEALVQGDAERLGPIAAEKASRLESLSRLGEQRNRYLAGQNLQASAAGMRSWLKRNSALAAVAGSAWQELLRQAAKAQQLNNSNGLLIANRLQQNRMQLSVLQAAAAPEGVYRADGQLRPLRSARCLSQV